MSLNELQTGECGEIIKSSVRRLRELGLVKGKKICKVKKAPLGSSAEYSILDYRLIIRDTAAESVFIKI